MLIVDRIKRKQLREVKAGSLVQLILEKKHLKAVSGFQSEKLLNEGCYQIINNYQLYIVYKLTLINKIIFSSGFLIIFF